MKEQHAHACCSYLLHRSLIPHPPQGHDHADGKQDAANNTSYTEEDHFAFDVPDEPGLIGDMQIRHQGLQAPFIHEVPEINKGCARDEQKQNGGSNHRHLDPFGPCDKGEGQQKNIAGKGDEKDDEQDVLSKERESRDMDPDRKDSDHNHKEGEDPPYALDNHFLPANRFHFPALPVNRCSYLDRARKIG